MSADALRALAHIEATYSVEQVGALDVAVLRAVAMAADRGQLTAHRSIPALMRTARIACPKTWRRHCRRMAALGLMRIDVPPADRRGIHGSRPNTYTVVWPPDQQGAEPPCPALDGFADRRGSVPRWSTAEPQGHGALDHQGATPGPAGRGALCHYIHTEKHITNPPPNTPNLTTGEGGVGGTDVDWTRGWATRWTPEAREAVDDMRWSNDDRTVNVAEVFIAAVRGLLAPPRNVDQAAYLRQLGGRLRALDADALRALAEHQLETRSQDLDSVANLEARAKKPQALATATAASEIVGVQIRASADRREADAWIAYATRHAPRPSANPHVHRVYAIGVSLRRGWPTLVPTRMPPANATENTYA